MRSSALLSAALVAAALVTSGPARAGDPVITTQLSDTEEDFEFSAFYGQSGPALRVTLNGQVVRTLEATPSGVVCTAGCPAGQVAIDPAELPPALYDGLVSLLDVVVVVHPDFQPVADALIGP